MNGDHRYFRVNPALGFVRELSDSSSLLFNYREANRAPSPVELACADPAHLADYLMHLLLIHH